MSEEQQALQYQIEVLRRVLNVLYTYSPKIREQRDTLVKQRDRLVEAFESGISWIRDDYRVSERTASPLKQLDDAIAEARKDKRLPLKFHVLCTLWASTCHAWSEARIPRSLCRLLFDRARRLTPFRIRSGTERASSPDNPMYADCRHRASGLADLQEGQPDHAESTLSIASSKRRTASKATARARYQN
jgi:hypothetical protein